MFNHAASTLARFVFGGAPGTAESQSSAVEGSPSERSLVAVSPPTRSPDKGVKESLLALVLAPEPRGQLGSASTWPAVAKGPDEAVGRRVRDLVAAATPRIWRDLEDAAAALMLAPPRNSAVSSITSQDTPWRMLQEACSEAHSSLGSPVSGVRTVRVAEKRSRAEGTSIEIQELSARQGGRYTGDVAGRATESRTEPLRKKARKVSHGPARPCGMPLCYCCAPAGRLSTPMVYSAPVARRR